MESIVIGLIASTGTIIVAIIGKAASKKDAANVFLEKVLTEVDELRDDVKDLRTEVDTARAAMFASERRSNDLRIALARGLHALRSIAEWVQDGAKPPPPDVTRTIEALETAMQSDDK